MKRVIEPGDRLNLVCIYDTTNKPDTKFGEGSDEEMCLEFIAYYPKLTLEDNPNGMLSCGSVNYRQYRYPNGTTVKSMTAGSRNYSTNCWRKMQFGKDNFTLVNPDIPDTAPEDTIRVFDKPNNSCMVYGSDGSDMSEYSNYVYIIMGTAAGFLIVGLVYALTQLNRQNKQYKKVPVTDELERY